MLKPYSIGNLRRVFLLLSAVTAGKDDIKYCFNAFMKKRNKNGLFFLPNQMFARPHLAFSATNILTWLSQKRLAKDKCFEVFGHPLCDTFLILKRFFCTGAEFFLQKKFKRQKLLYGTWQIFS